MLWIGLGFNHFKSFVFLLVSLSNSYELLLLKVVSKLLRIQWEILQPFYVETSYYINAHISTVFKLRS